ncbi:cytochrome P450 [Actinorugispora endophytica]|uniref:Cytochrome P450 n=1 Tax=Actinorugispora endophytica TaxID=1605990 RepID=A0A4R6V4T6_9ACTN|nr:cytochrome P450 [Actinorugispora endophytica]TDQ53746.1 cytochrome P450 [Actinorugispora endophytica]
MTDSMTTPAEMIASWNPTVSPHREDPNSYYAWAQQQQPVAWSELVQAWVVTRYEDIRQVVTSPETFSSSVAVPPLDKILPPDVLAILAQAGPPGVSVLQTDPPAHDAMRRIGEQVVRGPRINRAIDYMRQAAHELLDSAGEGEIDLVSQFASPYVHRVLNRLVGIPDEDMERVDAWNNSFLGLMAPSTDHETKIALAHQFLDYENYLAELIAARQAEPRDDMASALVAVYDDELGADPGESLAEMRMWLRGLFAGGIHTTKDAIVSTVWTLLTTDGGEPWRQAVADRKSIGGALEEVLRLEAPHRGLTRLALHDTTIAGVEIQAGQQVMLLYGAANRDSTVFDQPGEFRPGRDNIKQHMAFGHGSHRCLGRALARTEAREALTVLTQRRPEARIAEDWKPEWTPEFYFRGLTSLRLA